LKNESFGSLDKEARKELHKGKWWDPSPKVLGKQVLERTKRGYWGIIVTESAKGEFHRKKKPPSKGGKGYLVKDSTG